MYEISAIQFVDIGFYVSIRVKGRVNKRANNAQNTLQLKHPYNVEKGPNHSYASNFEAFPILGFVSRDGKRRGRYVQ